MVGGRRGAWACGLVGMSGLVGGRGVGGYVRFDMCLSGLRLRGGLHQTPEEGERERAADQLPNFFFFSNLPGSQPVAYVRGIYSYRIARRCRHTVHIPHSLYTSRAPQQRGIYIMGDIHKTSIALDDETFAAWKESGKSLTDLVRMGLGERERQGAPEENEGKTGSGVDMAAVVELLAAVRGLAKLLSEQGYTIAPPAAGEVLPLAGYYADNGRREPRVSYGLGVPVTPPDDEPPAYSGYASNA
jgi:hypothetical protein